MPASDSLGGDLLDVVARINRWATAIADFPIPSAQARLLALIEAIGPARISSLAAADHSSQPTLTTQVQKLEDQGWARRAADPADARAALISITPSGQNLLRNIRRSRAAALAPALQALEAAQVARLRDAIDALEDLIAQAGRTAEESREVVR